MRKLFAVVAVMLMFQGCGPKGGDECSANEVGLWHCEDSTSLLVCGPRLGFVGPDRQWVKYPCRGGCELRNGGALVWCDFRGASEGDPCPTSPTGLAFCANSLSLLECSHGNWSARSCSSCTTSADLMSSCAP